MFLSDSFDVRQLPLNILFFNFDVFISYMIFFSLTYNPESGTEFILNMLRLWGKCRIFYFIFILYAYFVKSDKLLSNLIKFKYENIKLKKKPTEVV
jgi:hypothetical protein